MYCINVRVVLVGLKREWMIGQQLNTLSKDGKDLPGEASYPAPVCRGQLTFPSKHQPPASVGVRHPTQSTCLLLC